MTYFATQELFCGNGSDDPIAIEVRYSYTVSPGCAQTLTQPAEDASPNITKVEVKLDGKWVESPHVNAILDLVFDDDEIGDWLVAQANEAEICAADDAADHKRRMQRDDANG